MGPFISRIQDHFILSAEKLHVWRFEHASQWHKQIPQIITGVWQKKTKDSVRFVVGLRKRYSSYHEPTSFQHSQINEEEESEHGQRWMNTSGGYSSNFNSVLATHKAWTLGRLHSRPMFVWIPLCSYAISLFFFFFWHICLPIVFSFLGPWSWLHVVLFYAHRHKLSPSADKV